MSRSGTTLLTAILDSHPNVSMGYELLPAGLTDVDEASGLIDQARVLSDNDADRCAKELRRSGHKQLAALVKRSARSRVGPRELLACLNEVGEEFDGNLASFEGRVAISLAIVQVKSSLESTEVCGFKLNAPSIASFDAAVEGESAYIYILRDPRDVWLSHVDNDFGRSIDQVTLAWNNYLARFEQFARTHERTYLLRYESLVTDPAATLDRLCQQTGLSRASEMDNFRRSKASIHGGGHINDAQLQRGFFTSSVGRFRDVLSNRELLQVETACRAPMDRHGYERVADA